MARIPTLPKRKWSRIHAAHLAARAGFGPTPSQLTRLETMTPEEAVAYFLTYPAETTRNQAPDWFYHDQASHRLPNGLDRATFRKLPEEERRMMRQKQQREDRKNLRSAQAWWLERMVNSDHPLEEKLTLFWHGHFATSSQKVRAAYPMLSQNLTFREQGIGSFAMLVEAVSKDPAMLLFLDNARSNRRKPNENYARELMELFTLGEGHYTEDDIRNAARALTGWSMNATKWEFQLRPFLHDKGTKRFMGESGRFDGSDIISIILKRPRASEFLAERLWRFFASETVPRGVVSDLSKVLQQSDFDLKQALRALFLHEDFYHENVIRTQIKGPVQLVTHLCRTLNSRTPPGQRMAQACNQLGQILFAPPSVKGWDGGAAWITASTLAMRYQIAERLVKMRGSFQTDHFFPDGAPDRKEARIQLFDRFYHHPLGKKEQAHMDQVLAGLPPPDEWQRAQYITVLLHLVQQPQFQLT